MSPIADERTAELLRQIEEMKIRLEDKTEHVKSLQHENAYLDVELNKLYDENSLLKQFIKGIL